MTSATLSAPVGLTAEQQSVFGSLRVLTMFVTNICNAKCETCFYWMNLNNADTKNLKLDEIAAISRTMPKFPHLLVSGGEPVMRRELPEIVDIFARQNGLTSLDMPTNGLLTKRVVEVVETVMEQHPHLTITVGHSLDGFKETHDRLRGVKNNFEKLFETMEALSEMRRRREERARAGQGPAPRLRLLTLTCINNQNHDEIDRLADWVSTTKDVDGMMFECLRGTPKDPDLLPPTPEQFDQIVRKSMEVNDRLMSRRFANERPERLAYLRSTYRVQREHITTGKIPGTCRAGVRLGVLEPDGRVRFCELLDEVGDLRANNCDWSKVWFGEEATRQRSWIKDCRCSCTHCVNMGNSIDDNPELKRQRTQDQFVYARS